MAAGLDANPEANCLGRRFAGRGRTPWELEQTIVENRSFSPPVLVSVLGSLNLKAEELTALELGYGIKPVERLSFDAATFYNVYDRVIAAVIRAPRYHLPTVAVCLGSFQRPKTTPMQTPMAGKFEAQWRVTDNWKLSASYSVFH